MFSQRHWCFSIALLKAMPVLRFFCCSGLIGRRWLDTETRGSERTSGDIPDVPTPTNGVKYVFLFISGDSLLKPCTTLLGSSISISSMFRVELLGDCCKEPIGGDDWSSSMTSSKGRISLGLVSLSLSNLFFW